MQHVSDSSGNVPENAANDQTPETAEAGASAAAVIAAGGRPPAPHRQLMIVLLAITAVVSLLLGFGLPHLVNIEYAVTNFYYHFTWVLVITALTAAAWFWHEELPVAVDLRRRLSLAAAVGLAGALVMITAAQWEYRILADETNLLGLAMSLNIDRTYRNILEGAAYYDTFRATVYSLDPRPALHPFLLSLLHDLLGYQAYHAFILNFLASALSIGAVFYIGSALGGMLMGAMAALMLIANPIVLLGGTSAGFEPLNLAITTLSAWTIYGFIRNPSPRRLDLMVFTAVAAAHCRYESVVFVIPAGLAILYRWRQLRFDHKSWLLLLAPLLLLPYGWQRALHRLAHEVDASKPVFSPAYIWPNLQEFFRFALDREGNDFPMNPGIFSMVLVGTLGLVRVYITERPSRDQKAAVFLAFFGVLAVFLLHMSCWVVDFRTVPVQRYAMSYAAAWAIMAAWPLTMISKGTWGRVLAYGLVAFIVSQGLVKAGHNTQGRWLTLYREYKLTLEFMQKQPREGTKIIADRPGMFTVHHIGAISFEAANRNPQAILDDIRRKLAPRTFVVQHYFYDRLGKPEPHLADKLKTEPVLEFQNDAHYFVRLSRVLSADEAAAKALEASPADKKTDTLKVIGTGTATGKSESKADEQKKIKVPPQKSAPGTGTGSGTGTGTTNAKAK